MSERSLELAMRAAETWQQRALAAEAEVKNIPLLRSMYAQAEAEVTSLRAEVVSLRTEDARYWSALKQISGLHLVDASPVALSMSRLARLALGASAGADGCTCRRITYDEAYHELHEHGCPALDDN